MAVPDGYDLFGRGWPPELVKTMENHPLYPVFLHRAAELGFDTESGGFEESKTGYFLFFTAGHEWAALPPGGATCPTSTR